MLQVMSMAVFFWEFQLGCCFPSPVSCLEWGALSSCCLPPLGVFYWFQKFEFTSIFSVWGLNSPPAVERSEPYSQGLFLEAALGWAGIGHLLGSLPFPNLSRGCPAPGPGELQLRVTASEPLPQVGHCDFFRLKPSLQPRGALLFALGKADFLSPSFYPPNCWIWECSSQLLPLVTERTMWFWDSGAAESELFGEAFRSLAV